MAHFTIALYTSFGLWNIDPHVDCDNLFKARICGSALSCRLLTWAPQLSFRSKWTPRMWSETWRRVRYPSIWMTACKLWLYFALEKCIRWYFSGVNLIPCLSAQASHIPCDFSRFLQFSSVDFDHITMFISLISPPVVETGDWRSGSNVLTKNRNRIGDREKPCSIPLMVANWSPLNWSRSIEVFFFSGNAPKNLLSI